MLGLLKGGIELKGEIKQARIWCLNTPYNTLVKRRKLDHVSFLHLEPDALNQTML